MRNFNVELRPGHFLLFVLGDLLQCDVPKAPLVHPQKDVQVSAGAGCRAGEGCSEV